MPRLHYYKACKTPVQSLCLHHQIATTMVLGIDTTTLTKQLRTATMALGAPYGISPQDISIRSLRASGAMALLSARVDTDMI
jgi:hypothetical protein